MLDITFTFFLLILTCSVKHLLTWIALSQKPLLTGPPLYPNPSVLQTPL